MLLRRIKAHMKDENWFAVFIDFLVVVGGVGIALLAENVIRSQAVENDIAGLEKTLEQERLAIYLNALERIALSQCRVERVEELAEALQNSDEEWAAMPVENAQAAYLNTYFPMAWLEPVKRYSTHSWEAAITQGLVADMDKDRSAVLSAFHAAVEALVEFQNKTNELSTRLHPLALDLKLTDEAKLEFISILSEVDHTSALAELSAMQVKGLAEYAGLGLSNEQSTQLKQQLDAANALAGQLIGNCYKPVPTDFFVEE